MNYRQLQQELKEIKASGIKVNCRLNDKREVLHVEYARIVKNEVLAYDLVQSIGFHMADPNALFLCGVVFELIGDGNEITREIVDEFALSCGGDADEIWEGFMRQGQPEPQTEEIQIVENQVQKTESDLLDKLKWRSVTVQELSRVANDITPALDNLTAQGLIKKVGSSYQLKNVEQRVINAVLETGSIRIQHMREIFADDGVNVEGMLKKLSRQGRIKLETPAGDTYMQKFKGMTYKGNIFTVANAA